jgi:predicted ATPase
MSSAVAKLQNKYKLAHRYANFGAVIRRMQVYGFRGISDLSIDFEFPITAISGLNGAGKSTIGQLATCGYRMPTGAVGYKRFYVAQFFPVSVADPLPFDQNARVIYTLETNVAASPQDVTVSRTASEWSGYKRQPERYCFYIGFTLYIPKVERRDMSIYGGKTLQLMEKRTVTQKVGETVAQILNQAYEDVHFQGVSHGKRTSELGMLVKNGSQYSENNMGFGEGRVLHLVSLMEEAPAHSLFVLEEPETSLHEEAQHRLVQYLFDVCERRGHQIIFSTHSSEMLESLPSEARLLLYRDAQGVSAYKGLSSTRTRAILSGGVRRALTVCVEDHFAQRLLREIVRVEDPTLLKAISIVAIGSQDDVRESVRLLSKLGRRAIGIRDGDTGAAAHIDLHSLPGTRAPELEVFEHPSVLQRFSEDFGVDVSAVRATAQSQDHHLIPKLVADSAEMDVADAELIAIRAYVEALDPQERNRIKTIIASAA